MTTHGSKTVVGRRYVIVDLKGLLLETGVNITQHVEEDGDLEHGLDKAYIGRPAGEATIDVAHYAANGGVDFAATTPGTINDAATGFVTVLTGDTIVVKGSALNDGVYTVSTGGVAATIRTNEATVLEAVGPCISIYKQASISQNMVFDRNTGLLWMQLTTKDEKLGDASGGLLIWYDATECFEISAAGAPLVSIIEPNIIRLVAGAAEEAHFHVGDVLECTGFANGVNDLPGYYVLSVTVNGADLDIVVEVGNNTMIAEASVDVTIDLVCKSAFAYASGACEATFGGYNDWRVPNLNELLSLLDFSLSPVTPDVATFPGWPYDSDGGWVWASTTDAATPANAYQTGGDEGAFVSTVKTGTANVALVRGG